MSLIDASGRGEMYNVKRLVEQSSRPLPNLMIPDKEHTWCTDARGKYPEVFSMMAAAGKGHLEIVKLFLDRGVNVNSQEDSTGNTALIHACMYGHNDVAKELLRRGALNYFAGPKHGQSALMSASRMCSVEIVRELLERGADIDQKYGNGVTALMCASQSGNTENVRVLLEHGANVDIKSDLGMTAIMFASKSNRCDTLKLLLSHEIENTLKNSEDNPASPECKISGKKKTQNKFLILKEQKLKAQDDLKILEKLKVQDDLKILEEQKLKARDDLKILEEQKLKAQDDLKILEEQKLITSQKNDLEKKDLEEKNKCVPGDPLKIKICFENLDEEVEGVIEGDFEMFKMMIGKGFSYEIYFHKYSSE